MSDPIRTIEHEDYNIKVYHDDHAESPREWDNLGTMTCFHGRYSLGDQNFFKTSQDLMKWTKRKDVISIPLYLYDHSGITMNTTGFPCPWDSGQVGWIHVERKRVREEFKKKRVSKKLLKKVVEILRAEVGIYDSYIRGNVFGYEIEDKEGEHIDSCWGYFCYDHMIEDAKNVIKNL